MIYAGKWQHLNTNPGLSNSKVHASLSYDIFLYLRLHGMFANNGCVFFCVVQNSEIHQLTFVGEQHGK